MKQWMPFVVALLSLTGAGLRSQNISASTQLKLLAGRRVLVLAGREISGEQLEQMLAGSNREPDVKLAKQLSELELTERLSAARLARCEAGADCVSRQVVVPRSSNIRNSYHHRARSAGPAQDDCAQCGLCKKGHSPAPESLRDESYYQFSAQ